MISISLCMIVKNEEDTIERCLASVTGVVDEIILVDTGSTDRTRQFAAKFTDQVLDFPWIDDFSAARNFAYSHATKDYILWLDADDIVLPEDAEKLKKLKSTMPNDVDAVMMRYNTAFDENGKATFSYFRERLSKRERGFRWVEPVHEYLAVSGKRINAEICITHAKPQERKGGRNLRIYEAKLGRGETLSPRGQYYYARELRDNGKYTDAVKWFTRFLDSGKGWVEDNITACGDLAQCLLAENRKEEALTAMLRSFRYDVPRAELCCQLGYYFKQQEHYSQAAYWFEQALQTKEDTENWGFRSAHCRGFIPFIELAVCYDLLGDSPKAEQMNEKALLCQPESKAALRNRAYFLKKNASHHPSEEQDLA